MIADILLGLLALIGAGGVVAAVHELLKGPGTDDDDKRMWRGHNER